MTAQLKMEIRSRHEASPNRTNPECSMGEQQRAARAPTALPPLSVKVSGRCMSGSLDVAIIGAGPYSLSLSNHLISRGFDGASHAS
jgi:hypothetical protein